MIDKILMDEALRRAASLRKKQRALQDKLDRLAAEMEKTQYALELAHSANDRANSFVPQMGSNYQCPICWIDESKQSDLNTASGSDVEDIMHCSRCGSDFRIPL